MARTHRTDSETEKRSNGHSSKEKDRNSIRQVTTIYVRKLCPLYSLMRSALVVRTTNSFAEVRLPGAGSDCDVHGESVRKNLRPATTALYNSVKVPRLTE